MKKRIGKFSDFIFFAQMRTHCCTCAKRVCVTVKIEDFQIHQRRNRIRNYCNHIICAIVKKKKLSRKRALACSCKLTAYVQHFQIHQVRKRIRNRWDFVSCISIKIAFFSPLRTCCACSVLCAVLRSLPTRNKSSTLLCCAN